MKNRQGILFTAAAAVLVITGSGCLKDSDVIDSGRSVLLPVRRAMGLLSPSEEAIYAARRRATMEDRTEFLLDAAASFLSNNQFGDALIVAEYVLKNFDPNSPKARSIAAHARVMKEKVPDHKILSMFGGEQAPENLQSLKAAASPFFAKAARIGRLLQQSVVEARKIYILRSEYRDPVPQAQALVHSGEKDVYIFNGADGYAPVQKISMDDRGRFMYQPVRPHEVGAGIMVVPADLKGVSAFTPISAPARDVIRGKVALNQIVVDAELFSVASRPATVNRAVRTLLERSLDQDALRQISMVSGLSELQIRAAIRTLTESVTAEQHQSLRLSVSAMEGLLAEAVPTNHLIRAIVDDPQTALTVASLSGGHDQLWYRPVEIIIQSASPTDPEIYYRTVHIDSEVIAGQYFANDYGRQMLYYAILEILKRGEFPDAVFLMESDTEAVDVLLTQTADGLLIADIDTRLLTRAYRTLAHEVRDEALKDAGVNARITAAIAALAAALRFSAVSEDAYAKDLLFPGLTDQEIRMIATANLYERLRNPPASGKESIEGITGRALDYLQDF